jgi:hypothetical protein
LQQDSKIVLDAFFDGLLEIGEIYRRLRALQPRESSRFLALAGVISVLSLDLR